MYIIQKVIKKKNRNIPQKPIEGVPNKQKKKEIFKIPVIVTDVSNLSTNWVKVKICGSVQDNEIIFGKEYAIMIDYLAVPSKEQSWNTLADL